MIEGWICGAIIGALLYHNPLYGSMLAGIYILFCLIKIRQYS